MKNLLFILLFIIIPGTVSAQNENEYDAIGYYFSINKQLFEGYLDQSYKPKLALHKKIKTEFNYLPGYIYDGEGNRSEGWCKIESKNYLLFKETPDSKPRKILPSECIGYSIGLDSTIVLQSSIFRNKKYQYADTVDFIKFLGCTEKYCFFVYRGYMGSVPKAIYIVYNREKQTFNRLPHLTAEYPTAAKEIFGEIECLKEAIENEEYTHSKSGELIKRYIYHKRAEQNEKIYFDAAFNELYGPKNAKYFARVLDINDSLTFIRFFFNDSTIAFDGYYDQISPLRKKGIFLWYYPDGTVRKKAGFVKNKMDTAITYHPNGARHRKYRKDYYYYNIYLSVKNPAGEELLDSEGNGREVFYDPIKDREIHYVYENSRIKAAWYTDTTGEKIYQLAPKNIFLKNPWWLFQELGSFLYPFKQNFTPRTIYPDESLLNYHEGTALIRIVIDTDGCYRETELVKGIDPAIDSMLISFFDGYKGKKYWNPAKAEGKKVRQEVLIPIVYNIEGFHVLHDNGYVSPSEANKNNPHYHYMPPPQHMPRYY